MFYFYFKDRTGGKCFYPARDFAISISARRTRRILMRVKARFKLIPSLLLTKSRNLEWGSCPPFWDKRRMFDTPQRNKRCQLREYEWVQTSEMLKSGSHIFHIFGFARKTSQPFHRASLGACQNLPVSAWAYNQHFINIRWIFWRHQKNSAYNDFILDISIY